MIRLCNKEVQNSSFTVETFFEREHLYNWCKLAADLGKISCRLLKINIFTGPTQCAQSNSSLAFAHLGVLEDKICVGIPNQETVGSTTRMNQLDY